MPSRIRVQNELVLRDRNIGIGSTLPSSKLSITQASDSQALDVGSQLKVDGSGVFNPSITIGSTVGAASTQKMDISVIPRENGLFEISNFGGNQLFSVTNDNSNDLFNIYYYNNNTNTKMFSVTNAGIVTLFGGIRVGTSYTSTDSFSFSEIYGNLRIRAPFSTDTEYVNIVPKNSDKGSLSFESTVGSGFTDRGEQVFSVSNNFDNYIFSVNDLNRSPILRIIGVGTTNDQARLEVVGTTRFSSADSTANEKIDIKYFRNIAPQPALGVATNNRGAISVESTAGVSTDGITIFPASLFAITNDPTGNVLSVSGYNYWSGSRVPAFDVTQSGRIGIGVTDPISDFEIRKDSTVTGEFQIKNSLVFNQLVNPGINSITNVYLKPYSPGIASSAPIRGSSVFEGVIDSSLNGGQLVTILNDNSDLFTINTFLGLSSSFPAPTGFRNIRNILNIPFNGNIGIGTTRPIQQIQVGNTNSVGVSTDGNILVVTSTGSVGVGTTNPNVKLDVRGDVNITGITTIGLGSTSSPTMNSTMSFELTDNTTLTIRVRGTDGVIRTAFASLT